METLTLIYHDAIYRILFDPDTLAVVEIVQFTEGKPGVVVDFDELNEELQDKIERAVSC